MKVLPVEATCPICKLGKIHVTIKEIPFYGESRIGGPRRTREFEIHSICCNNPECMLMFRAVPGQPGLGDQLRKKVQAEANPLD